MLVAEWSAQEGLREVCLTCSPTAGQRTKCRLCALRSLHPQGNPPDPQGRGAAVPAVAPFDYGPDSVITTSTNSHSCPNSYITLIVNSQWDIYRCLNSAIFSLRGREVEGRARAASCTSALYVGTISVHNQEDIKLGCVWFRETEKHVTFKLNKSLKNQFKKLFSFPLKYIFVDIFDIKFDIWMEICLGHVHKSRPTVAMLCQTVSPEAILSLCRWGVSRPRPLGGQILEAGDGSMRRSEPFKRWNYVEFGSLDVWGTYR